MHESLFRQVCHSCARYGNDFYRFALLRWVACSRHGYGYSSLTCNAHDMPHESLELSGSDELKTGIAAFL